MCVLSCVCLSVRLCHCVDVLSSLCHWGETDTASDLEVDVYDFVASCMKGQRGES